MNSSDDRIAFENNQKRQAQALGRDRGVFDKALGVMYAADEYDYAYLWNWMGVPIIQLPADIMATQEVIWATKPDVIIETGVARGGSVIFMASLLELIGKGKVVGVDIDIRSHNRETIEQHRMSKRITLIEGSSVASDTLEQVKAQLPANAKVMVVLDSNHTREHVLAEMRAYGPLVTAGCYMVVADTVVGHISEQDARKRSKSWFKGDDPLSALEMYMKETDRFESDPVINGKLIFASSPGGYLKCKSIR